MRVAIITEISTAAKNVDIVKGTKGIEHEFFNLGMKGTEGEPELSTVETGFLTGLLLNLECVDFIIGGCGTGQGYMNSALQYPNVVCGLINDPLNAWLFPQINGGNCVSLSLNKDYGWAGDINLAFILRELFSVAPCVGYPEYRKVPQEIIRGRLRDVSLTTHMTFVEILDRMGRNGNEVLRRALTFPGIQEFIEKNYRNEELYRSVGKIQASL